jgi:hypothetical protein
MANLMGSEAMVKTGEESPMVFVGQSEDDSVFRE